MKIAYCSKECESKHSHIVDDFKFEVIKEKIEYVSFFDTYFCIMLKNDVMVSASYTDNNYYSLHVANWADCEYNFTYGNICNLDSEACASALDVIARLSA